MTRLFSRFPRRRGRGRAQSMTEYVIIVGLVGIAMIGTVQSFQGALAASYTKATKEVQTKVTEPMQR